MMELNEATHQDFSEILEMIKEIYEELPQKEWFFLDDDETLLKYMTEDGFALKAVCERQLAGVFIVRTENLKEEHIGYDLGFSEEQRKIAAHMEIAMVKSMYRGQGLQRKMMEKAEEILKEKGFCYLLGTAHPDNKASVRSFQKAGYSHVMTKEKYGGLVRCIFCKELYKE